MIGHGQRPTPPATSPDNLAERRHSHPSKQSREIGPPPVLSTYCTYTVLPRSEVKAESTNKGLRQLDRLCTLFCKDKVNPRMVVVRVCTRTTRHETMTRGRLLEDDPSNAPATPLRSVQKASTKVPKKPKTPTCARGDETSLPMSTQLLSVVYAIMPTITEAT